MNIEDVKKLDPFERLVYWITERESIRLKKEAGEPRPWTDDEILNTYRFCNVRRMDDRVSQWLLKNWYEPYKDHKNIVLACVLARHFNQPSTLDAIGFPTRWEPKRILARIEKYKTEQSSAPVFNGAYIIRASKGWPDKSEMVIKVNCQQFVDNPLVIHNRLERLVESLSNYWNMGSFMSGQVAADLRWATSVVFKDRLRWAAIGPGSRRGMNRLLGRDIKSPMSQTEFNHWFGTDVLEYTKSLIPRSISKRLEAIDYQNCLCEFDKYERTLFDGRRPKSKYKEFVGC